MPDQQYPQFARNGLRSQVNDTLFARPRSGVVQEKIAHSRDLKASVRPDRVKSVRDHGAANSKHTRSHRRPTADSRTATLTLHPSPILKAEVQRIAEIDGLSVSAAGTALLEWAVRQTLHLQQAATLESALEAIIDRKLRRRDDRLASLLIHNRLTGERTLHIVTQLLNLTPGLTPEIVGHILDKAKMDARRKIANRNPQLEEDIRELKEILAAKENQEEKRPPPK